MSGQLIGRGYMTIVGLRDGDPASTYVLLPSVESVTKKLDGTLSVGEVYCSVYKVTGSSAYALSADHTLRYVRKPDGATDILEHANGVSDSIAVLSDTESIEFELSDDTNVIDRVRIPILSDATDVNDELDLYRYLREAIANGDTQFKGGLMLSSLIRLGEWANADTDNPTMAKVWSGMNGLYKNGRTIANWWGGDMVDLFDENNNKITPIPLNAAAALVRMNGTGYFAKGNIQWNDDGSGSVAGGNLRWDAAGNVIIGSGIQIGDGSGTDKTTLASILNFINNLTKLIVPVNEQKEELSWAHPNVADCYALKAKKGLYAMGFLSAHGLNADGGGGGAAYDRLDAWADYSTDREGWVLSALLGHDLHTRLEAIEGDYVKLSDLPSLTGYATEQWVLSKGYITQDALTPYLTKTDADGRFVTALGVSGNYLTWTKGGVTNNLTVPFATDADTLDGYHESSFLRARGLTRTDQEETPWDQIGIKGYYDALPAGLSSDVYPYGQVITLCETSARFEIYASHNSSAGNGLYFRTGWNNGKRPWQMLLDTGNYSTILDGRYSHTLTLQLNGTEIGTFNPTANKTINIGDVASAAALASHTSNTTVHITATERALWNKAASDLSTILGSDSDTVINKWEEVVAFLDTYTEADTLAGLLGNKVDKVAGYGLSKNDFNDTLLAKLNSIEAGANRYVLPTASATVKGGIKVGSGLMMASEVLSVNLNASHIPALDWSKIATGKPTTLGGYGITDAKIAGGVITLGSNTITPLTQHQSLADYFKRNAGGMPNAYVDITDYSYNAPDYQNFQAGTYQVRRQGFTELVVNLALNTGSTSALQFYTGYFDASTLHFRKTIDSNRVSGPWRTILTELNIGQYALTSTNYTTFLDSRYQQSANIHALTLAAGAFSAKTYDPKSAALTVNIPNTTDHIAEGGNLYFTNARAVSALSSTTNALQAAINTKLSEATFNAFKTAFDGMFELVNIGTDAAPRYAIHAKYGLYSDSFLSAHGRNDAGGSGGSSYSRLDAWNAYDSSKEGYVLSAKLGYDLYQNKADSAALNALASRVGTLEGKNYLDALTLNQSGSGNAVTAIGLSADKKTLSVTKGATFLTQHQSLANYYTKPEIDNKVSKKKHIYCHQTSIYDLRYNFGPYNRNDFPTGEYYSEYPSPYGQYISLAHDNKNSAALIFIDSGDVGGHVFINTRKAGNTHTTYDGWKKVAYVTDTVDNALKLGGVAASGYAKLTDIPSLSGYATESWVLGKNYLIAITKAMVENVLTGNITTHTHSQYLTQHQPLDHIDSLDTRGDATTPSTYGRGLRANFKLNSINGLSDGGTYNGELHFKPYGRMGDHSGGYPHQLGFTVNGNVWHRIATSATDWGAWRKFLDSDNTKISGGVITINGTSITPLTSHQSLANYVTINTAQTISALKTFNATTRFNGGMFFKAADADAGVFFAPMTDGSVSFNSHENYVLKATLGRLYQNGRLLMQGFIKQGGTASQFLKADGSVDSNTYALSSALGNYVTLATAQTISGAKTFSNVVVVQDGIRILYANERGYLQLGNTDHKQGEISAWNGVPLEKLRLNAGIVDVYGYVTANSFVRNGGTSAQFLKADGSVDSNSYALASALGNYLPLAGGTLTGLLHVNVNGTTFDIGGQNSMYIHLCSNVPCYFNKNIYTAGSDIYVSGGSYRVWHAGNDGAGSGLDADTVDGKHNGQLSAVDAQYLKILGGIFPSEYPTVKAGKDRLVEIFAAQGAGIGFPVEIGSDYINKWGSESATVNNSSTHTLIKIGGHYSGAANGQWLLSLYGANRLGVVGRANNAWTDISYLAFLTDNVASATKLADNATYTAWGRPFFANGKPQNVSGDLTGVGNIAMRGDISGVRSFMGVNGIAPYLYSGAAPTNAGSLGSGIGFGLAHNGFGTYIWGTGDGNGHIQVGRADGTQAAYNLILQEFGGNVGIGTTSPLEKLHVNGAARISGALKGATELYTSGPIWFKKTDESKGAYFSPGAGGSIGLYFHENYGYKLCTAYFANNGNIGFGTVSPAYKVDIVGTAKISEGLLIGGLLSANGGISTTAITATEIHLGPITLKYNATDKGLQVIGGGLYTDSYLSAHGPSPTTADYEARIAALESKIAQLENQLSA